MTEMSIVVRHPLLPFPSSINVTNSVRLNTHRGYVYCAKYHQKRMLQCGRECCPTPRQIYNDSDSKMDVNPRLFAPANNEMYAKLGRVSACFVCARNAPWISEPNKYLTCVFVSSGVSGWFYCDKSSAVLPGGVMCRLGTGTALLSGNASGSVRGPAQTTGSWILSAERFCVLQTGPLPESCMERQAPQNAGWRPGDRRRLMFSGTRNRDTAGPDGTGRRSDCYRLECGTDPYDGRHVEINCPGLMGCVLHRIVAPLLVGNDLVPHFSESGYVFNVRNDMAARHDKHHPGQPP